MCTLPDRLSVFCRSFIFNFALFFTNHSIPVFLWSLIKNCQTMLIFHRGNVDIKIKVFLTKCEGIIVQEFVISFLHKLVGLLFLFALSKAILLLKNIWHSFDRNHTSCLSEFAKWRHFPLTESHSAC